MVMGAYPDTAGLDRGYAWHIIAAYKPNVGGARSFARESDLMLRCSNHFLGTKGAI